MKKLMITPEGEQLVDLTADDIAYNEAYVEKEANDAVLREAAEEKHLADKTSGNQKLKDLGLTDDEISALVG